MKEVFDENEQLIVRLNEDEGCSAKLRVEIDKIKLDLASTKHQNDILIKKCALKQDKVEEIMKVYENRGKYLIWVKVSNAFNIIHAEQIVFMFSVNQLKSDIDVLHGEYMKVKAENVAFKEKSNSFLEVQEEFKKRMQEFVPLSVHTVSVNECKK